VLFGEIVGWENTFRTHLRVRYRKEEWSKLLGSLGAHEQQRVNALRPQEP